MKLRSTFLGPALPETAAQLPKVWRNLFNYFDDGVYPSAGLAALRDFALIGFIQLLQLL